MNDKLKGKAKQLEGRLTGDPRRTAESRVDEANYKGTESAQFKATQAKVEADYQIAQEHCDDLSGTQKDICNQEAGQASRDADYDVELEKCNQYSGDAKEQCINAAKHLFGK